MPPKITELDIKKINANFDSIITSLTQMALKVKPTMPLVATSLALTIDLVEVYKQAFNATIGKQ